MNNEEKILSTLDVVVEKVSGLETRFDGIETRFDGIETRFDGIETRFDGIETRFDGLETRFDGLETRIGSLETGFGGLKTRFDGLETGFVGMKERQASMEIVQNKLVEEVISMKDYMYNELATKQELHGVETRLIDQMDGLVKLHQDHDVEIVALNARMGRVEGRIFGA